MKTFKTILWLISVYFFAIVSYVSLTKGYFTISIIGIYLTYKIFNEFEIDGKLKQE